MTVIIHFEVAKRLRNAALRRRNETILYKRTHVYYAVERTKKIIKE